ncbi:hypothetical protein [Haloglomus irregulare]|nr:hypothetical protein [Haloglomus irregulare]
MPTRDTTLRRSLVGDDGPLATPDRIDRLLRRVATEAGASGTTARAVR